MATGLTKVLEYRGERIERWVLGYAYARNGNTHNPTPRVTWRCREGSFPTLRAAKAALDEVLA